MNTFGAHAPPPCPIHRALLVATILAVLAGHVSGQDRPPASPKNGTVIENFNCPSEGCFFSMSGYVQADSVVACTTYTTWIYPASHTTGYADTINYPDSIPGPIIWYRPSTA